jgi:MFS family permease
MMTDILRPVTALLMAAAILMTGNGLLGVLVPIRADLAHFTRLEIGAMGSIYYAGLMLGCLVAPAIIARVGHIRAFTAFTASATITPLLHAMWLDPWVWAGLRGLNGLCFAGLFMGIESWLSGASTSETRGRVLAAYTVINLTVVTFGMQMLALTPPGGFELFSLVAILYSLAAVPVCMTTTPVPAPPTRAKLRIVWLYSVSPVSVLGCFFTGVANSGFWQLSALYASESGLSIHDVALFVTIAVLGGAIGQWPVGMVSDRLGRRPLLMVCGIAASAAGLGLFAAAQIKPPTVVLFALAAGYGLMAFPIYTLCVAHANDLVHKKRAVEVSSGLLLVFSVGAVIGPLVASAAMAGLGNGALFLHTAIAHLLIAGITLVRSQVRPSLPNRRQEEYVVVPNSTPAMFELDPRGAENILPDTAIKPAADDDRQKPAA